MIDAASDNYAEFMWCRDNWKKRNSVPAQVGTATWKDSENWGTQLAKLYQITSYCAVT